MEEDVKYGFTNVPDEVIYQIVDHDGVGDGEIVPDPLYVLCENDEEDSVLQQIESKGEVLLI